MVGILGAGSTADPGSLRARATTVPHCPQTPEFTQPLWASTTPKPTSSDILSSSPTLPHSLLGDSRDSVK